MDRRKQRGGGVAIKPPADVTAAGCYYERRDYASVCVFLQIQEETEVTHTRARTPLRTCTHTHTHNGAADVDMYLFSRGGR